METYHQVWERDEGICQRCKIPLLDEVDHYQLAEEELSKIKEIPIYKWKNECWACHKETDMVSYYLLFLYNFSIGNIDKLDKILAEKYPFVKKGYSKMQRRDVIANWCIHCGILQGNFYVPEQLMERFNEGIEEELIDIKIPNTLTGFDIPIEEEREEFVSMEKNENVGHVHHKDCNRENNSLDNLVLLCRKCHYKTHTELRKKG